MSVYVDRLLVYPDEAIDPKARWLGHSWCHLWADSTEELLVFVDRLGIPRKHLQAHRTLPHFDLTPSKRAQAVALGAIEMNLREALEQRRKGVTHGT